VSPTFFDQLVTDRLMPRPKRIGRRCLWDRIQLDAAFTAPNDGEEDRADDVWARRAV
jgi:hypothetical protein